MKLEYFVSTDIGMERELNEDSIASFVFNMEIDGKKSQVGFFAVSDGMGGHNAGEIASLVAIRELVMYVNSNYYNKLFERKYFELPEKVYNYHFVKKKEKKILSTPEKVLKRAIKRANRKIIELSRQNPAFFGMGATLVSAIIENNSVTVANIGDSRFYLINKNDGIRLISVDHTVVNQMVKLGSLTEEEAKHHPGKNFLYKSLGIEEDVLPDIFKLNVKRGDFLLLCSDGLTNMVDEDRIFDIIVNAKTLRRCVRKLIKEANKNGGKDNISVILVKILK